MSGQLPHEYRDRPFENQAQSHSRPSARSSMHGRSHGRMPSTSGYMVAAAAAAAALFFILWWMLESSGDENPWVPAGLAASVVMLVAVSAREVVMRRAWTRYLLEQNKPSERTAERRQSGSRAIDMQSRSGHATVLRALQKQSAAAEVAGALPEAHLEVYHLCEDYLASTNRALDSSRLRADQRLALRGGQERVRALQRHHLLTWARGAARAYTREAQQRGRLSEKIEMANRALECIDTALKVYPEEVELHESARAVREFMTSVRVAHWVELAERAAFKGQHRRAIDRYRNAMFYLNKEDMDDETRRRTAERIGQEIELMRQHLSDEHRPASRQQPPPKNSQE
jgi:hypothetical protein